MNCRIMRMIIFFDLPTITSKDLKNYRNFRRFLIKNGFIMMQESVYSRLVLNNNSAQLLKKQIYKNLPDTGLIQLLQVTEKQFANIEYMRGKSQSKVLDSNERIVII